MSTRLLIPRELIGNPEEFAAAWNDDLVTLKLAIVTPAPRAPVLDAHAWEVATFVLSNVALGISANVLCDVVKSWIAKHRASEEPQQPRRRTRLEVREVTWPDGTRDYTVTEETEE